MESQPHNHFPKKNVENLINEGVVSNVLIDTQYVEEGEKKLFSMQRVRKTDLQYELNW